MLKAIETRYKGYRFRSRLEARWAVFFDALGVEWEYEKEGFDLGEAGWYLPDFWLPTLRRFVEVKGERGDGSFSRKARALQEQSGCLVVCLVGSLPSSSATANGVEWQGIKATLPVSFPLSRLSASSDEYLNEEASSHVICPLCRTNFVHIERPSVELVDSRVESLIVPMWCENGCSWNVDLSFHAGESCATVRNVTGYTKSLHAACGLDPRDDKSAKQVNDALKVSRAARFEHGENG